MVDKTRLSNGASIKADKIVDLRDGAEWTKDALPDFKDAKGTRHAVHSDNFLNVRTTMILHNNTDGSTTFTEWQKGWFGEATIKRTGTYTEDAQGNRAYIDDPAK
jgi:hypothetical protein